MALGSSREEPVQFLPGSPVLLRQLSPAPPDFLQGPLALGQASSLEPSWGQLMSRKGTSLFPLEGPVPPCDRRTLSLGYPHTHENPLAVLFVSTENLHLRQSLVIAGGAWFAKGPRPGNGSFACPIIIIIIL